MGCTKLGEWNNAAGDRFVKWQGKSYSCGDGDVEFRMREPCGEEGEKRERRGE